MVEIRHKDTGDVLLRLEGDTLERASLNGADLIGADLSGLVLRGASLRGANLSHARLEEATLADADLRGAALVETNLRRAKMGGAHLSGACLWNADLEGAVLVSGSIAGAALIQANLRGMNLSYTSLAGASMSDAHLEGAILRDAGLAGANLTRADLRGADLSSSRGAEWSSVHFCVLAGAIYDTRTCWPEGFSPQQYGALSVAMTDDELDIVVRRAIAWAFGCQMSVTDRVIVVPHGKKAFRQRSGQLEEEAPWTTVFNVLCQFPEGRFRELAFQRLCRKHLKGRSPSAQQPDRFLVLERPGEEVIFRKWE
jgi:hypothetical protein